MQALRVVEFGDRIAVAACGSLLASLGAEVVLVEPPQPRTSHKWSNRPLAAAGKRSLRAGPDDKLLHEILAGADVIITSSDAGPALLAARAPQQIVCDITAYGSSGPLAGTPHTDALVQAATGLADITGEEGGAPVPTGFALTEGIAALYAAIGIQAALRERARGSGGQTIEVALHDGALAAMTSHIGFAIAGKPITRGGNRHVLASPWNAYRSADGWIIVCTGTDEQWRRLCAAIGAPALAEDPRLATGPGRVEHRAEVDGALEAWTAQRSAAQSVGALQEAGIACGPILPVSAQRDEPNLRHRRAVLTLRDPVSGSEVEIAGNLLRSATRAPIEPRAVPRPDQDRALLADTARPTPSSSAAVRRPGAPPLAGLRVLEIGQYTTAPLAARVLASLGAEVLKIEPPSGEVTRNWTPGTDGQSHFFAITNTGKRSLRLDLRDAADRARFEALLRRSDVLLENLKPGSLDRLGFAPDALARLNPRLVYCGISGFGADSAYPERPAFDTVVQAMSGMMDLIRTNGVPQKTGISSADVVGGLSAAVAVLDALARREADGRGDRIDISMQDAGAWITRWRQAEPTMVERDGDGWVFRAGDASMPVRSVAESVAGEQTRARSLLLAVRDAGGRERRAVASPIRLSLSPSPPLSAIGEIGEANRDLDGPASGR